MLWWSSRLERAQKLCGDRKVDLSDPHVSRIPLELIILAKGGNYHHGYCCAASNVKISELGTTMLIAILERLLDQGTGSTNLKLVLRLPRPYPKFCYVVFDASQLVKCVPSLLSFLKSIHHLFT